jgi:hypothetical protein
MADETDLDLDVEALERALGAGDEPMQGSIGRGAAPFHGGPMEAELTEALPSSPGRPSESYEPDLPNWAVEGSNAQKMPGSGLACVTCPEAVWMTGGEDLQAFCRVLRGITWSARENVPMQIEICNGKEMAILAMQEAQAREELKEQLKPSR